MAQNPDTFSEIDLGMTEIDRLLSLPGTKGLDLEHRVEKQMELLQQALKRGEEQFGSGARRVNDMLDRFQKGIYTDVNLNILTNGDFQATWAVGVPPSWTAVGAPAVTKCAMVLKGGDADATVGMQIQSAVANEGVFQRVTAVGDTDYTLNFWYKSTSATSFGRVRIVENPGGQVWNLDLDRILAQTDHASGLHVDALRVHTDAATTTFDVQLLVAGGAGVQTAQFTFVMATKGKAEFRFRKKLLDESYVAPRQHMPPPGASYDLDSLRGRDGIPGRRGRDGTNGIDGVPGHPGPPIPGRDGEPGAAIPGRRGVKGDTGTTGATGAAGPRGKPVPIPGADGQPGYSIPGRRGIKGDTGSTGGTGATGATGPRGKPMPIPGPKGETGASIPGRRGLTGAAGAAGADGAPGAPGATGAAGARGKPIPIPGAPGKDGSASFVPPRPQAGRFLKTTVLTSGTSHTVSGATRTIFVRVQAGGGGGGAIATALSSGGGGGGGSAGGYAEKTFTVTPNTAYTYAIGAAGAAGTAGGNGGVGGVSTFAVGAVTVTANGGLGGIGGTAVAQVQAFLGGASPAVSTSGDVNGGGAPGGYGLSLRANGVAAVSGAGGSCLFGAGGNSVNTQSVGAAGIGKGAGGSGACLLSGGASVDGGAGLAGIIVVDEYS